MKYRGCCTVGERNILSPTDTLRMKGYFDVCALFRITDILLMYEGYMHVIRHISFERTLQFLCQAEGKNHTQRNPFTGFVVFEFQEQKSPPTKVLH